MDEKQVTLLTRHVREHAHQYFTDLASGEVDVKPVSAQQRPYSALYRFEVQAATQRRFVFVKVPTSRGSTRSDKRPYLVPETDPAIKFRLHYVALVAIHDHFEPLDDPRFGTVRMLDLLPDLQALVMEEVQAPPLQQLLPKASRVQLSLGSKQLDPAFRNAGAWLRAYHTLPYPDPTEVIHAERDDYIDLMTTFTTFLTRALGDTPFFQNMASMATENALQTLPESLPLGLRFGDYGMTNILVGPNGRITGIDTLGRWRTPIYEDIAYFLTGLKTTRIQVMSRGLAFSPACIARYEREFLLGYFGREPIPFREIRLYEILRLLEKWSAKTTGMNRKLAGKFAGVRGVGLTVVNAFYRKSMNRLLQATG